MSSADSADVSVQKQHKECVSCRMLSGCGLIAAGGYVYFRSRKFLTSGFLPTLPIWLVLGLTSFGVSILLKPSKNPSSNG